jgi:hypothetical protein
LRRLSSTTLSIRLFLGLGFAQGSSPAPGSIRCDVFPKGNGEPAVLRGALIVCSLPITSGSELYAKGAFAVDSLARGTYQIETNAPGLYAALADGSATGPVEMNMAAVTSMTSTQLTRLGAMDCAFNRKVRHHV